MALTFSPLPTPAELIVPVELLTVPLEIVLVVDMTNYLFRGAPKRQGPGEHVDVHDGASPFGRRMTVYRPEPARLEGFCRIYCNSLRTCCGN